MQTEIFKIGGMSCAACASRIQQQLALLAGVDRAQVNLLKNSLIVTFDPSQTDRAVICQRVRQLGYSIQLAQAIQTTSYPDRTATARGMIGRLYGSLFFSLILTYISMGSMLNWPLPQFLTEQPHILCFILLQFMLLLPVIVFNLDLYRNGLHALLSRSPNMNSLVALASAAALFFGLYTAVVMTIVPATRLLMMSRHGVVDLYLDSAAMILTLIRLGKFLESRSKQKTTDAITKLMDLVPKSATLIQLNSEIRIPLHQVRVDDLLIVKTGEQVPVDGVIVEGAGCLNEAAISGESLTHDKGVGDNVTGSTLNCSGHFIMRATRVGEDTTLAQIIKLVDTASSSAAPIARLADQISRIFVPIVLLIAIAATIFWLLMGYDIEFSLAIGIAVLVVCCPCALGLATPTAIMVGTGCGATQGILFKSAQALESAASTDIVVLDKTGTITEGRPTVAAVMALTTMTGEEMIRIAASLEKLSEHPLGTAIVTKAAQKRLSLQQVTGFAQLAGQGVRGTIGGIEYAIGNACLLALHHIVNPLAAKAELLANVGKTTLYLIREQELLGAIVLADKIKPGSFVAIAALQQMGIEVHMLTGDTANNAHYVCQRTGIDRIHANLLPQDKDQEIRRLQDSGKQVIMVGDGINDAPALARATVGIAIGAGTDIAIEAADIVLVKNDLQDVVTAIQLSRATLRNIKQNLFWAFIYNIIGIPVAAGLFYIPFGVLLSPMVAAAAMSCSSLCVVINALRLRFFKPIEVTVNMMKKIIYIDGMSCGHCCNAVTKALAALGGMQSVRVDLNSNSAQVEMMASISDAVLTQIITEAGYKVISIESCENYKQDH